MNHSCCGKPSPLCALSCPTSTDHPHGESHNIRPPLGKDEGQTEPHLCSGPDLLWAVTLPAHGYVPSAPHWHFVCPCGPTPLSAPRLHPGLCQEGPQVTGRVQSMGHTRKDRNTVLALTANDRTAATEQMRRSDCRTSFCEEKPAVVSLSSSVSPGKSGDTLLTLDTLPFSPCLPDIFPMAHTHWMDPSLLPAWGPSGK